MTSAVAVRSLKQCEQVIERGLQTFVEVGQALLEIRDHRLYRKSYATFEEYCQQRWGWSRRYVNYQIQAAEIVPNLGTIVPTHESQVRPLTVLPPEKQRAVWGAVTANGARPTARQVMAEVVRRVEAAVAPQRDLETDRKEEAMREQMLQNSVHLHSLMTIIDAVEVLAKPPVLMSEVADWIAQQYDSPNKDWRGCVLRANWTLKELLKELDV